MPRVLADVSDIKITDYKDLRCIGHFYLPEPDKWRMNDQGADYVYTGRNPIDFMLPNGLKEIRDYQVWLSAEDKQNKLPLFTPSEFKSASQKHAEINFLLADSASLDEEILELIRHDATVVLIIETTNAHAMAELRRLFVDLIKENSAVPVIVRRRYPVLSEDEFRIYASTDIGGLFIDGLGDGIMLSMTGWSDKEKQLYWADISNKTAFGILQATRNRMSKTEYISCPSCGRTLFDLQITTAMIRKRTDHLKGVKIGIMGCIVNGPGEMADADYGYVGSGPGRITLYRGKEVVKRNVPSAQAVDQLIDLIREDGNWIEPETVEQLTD